MKPSKITIVGCGGVGSWLLPSLRLLVPDAHIVLFDGDTLEEKNLNRQLFSPADLGKNKAQALAEKYGVEAQPVFYHRARIEHDWGEWIFCCADNHRARREVLAACDINECQAIIAANEKHSSEAYTYTNGWYDLPIDPRVYYPEITTDNSGDPEARAIGCTGQAQVETPQLVSSNFMAAALAQHLFVLWAMEAPTMSQEVIQRLPYKLVSNLSKLESFRICDAITPNVH